MDNKPSHLLLDPVDACITYIRPAVSTQGWLEDSAHVAPCLPLSKRELLGLILVAHVLTHQIGEPWCVGYDATDPEPNDGFVMKCSGGQKILFEHTLIPQFKQGVDPVEALKEALRNKTATKGLEYQKSRALMIHINLSSHPGLFKISDFTKAVASQLGDGTIAFNQVLSVGAVGIKGSTVVFHIFLHSIQGGLPQSAIAQVNLDLSTCSAEAPHVDGEFSLI